MVILVLNEGVILAWVLLPETVSASFLATSATILTGIWIAARTR